jgi:hypothetical protein
MWEFKNLTTIYASQGGPSMPGLDLTQMLPAKFGSIWPSCFRGEDFFNISQSEKRINFGGYVCPFKMAAVF